MVLGVGELWLSDQRVQRVGPVAGELGCMAALVGTKQLGLLYAAEQHGLVMAVLLSLPQRSDGASAEARLALEPLRLEPVVEARSGAQQLVVVMDQCPQQEAVDVLIAVF